MRGLQWIDASTLTGACEVVKHSLNEWASYSEVEVRTESDAEKLIKWLIRKCNTDKVTSIPKVVAVKGAPSHLRKAKAFDPCLNELIEFSYVRLVTINKTAHVELNPLLLE